MFVMRNYKTNVFSFETESQTKISFIKDMEGTTIFLSVNGIDQAFLSLEDVKRLKEICDELLAKD